MQIDWLTLAFQTVNALVLVWLLSKFLFKPVANIIAERQAAADRIVDEAKAAKAAAEDRQSEAEAEAAKLAASRNDALKAATQEANKQKAAILDAARAEADRLRTEAKKDIARARDAEEKALGERASLLAVDIAMRLLDRLPDEARISGFVEGLAEGVADLPDDVRAALGNGGNPLQISAPRALTKKETSQCREALGKVLARDVAIDVTVDPELIAGLELQGPHAEVRNSFRADLARLATDLKRHAENQH